jgi:hypothetical protein
VAHEGLLSDLTVVVGVKELQESLAYQPWKIAILGEGDPVHMLIY